MNPTKTTCLWSAAWRAAAALALPGALVAQTVLNSGHMDLGLAYEDGILKTHLHAHDPEPDGTEYEPDEVIIEVGPASKTTVPDNPAFSFLGPPGSPVYLLPSTENPELPFLGLAAEEVDSGIFAGNTLNLTLVNFSGPGEFALFTVDAFGAPSVKMNTRDGVDDSDFATVLAGSHGHANWAFSAPGDYELTLLSSGTLGGGAPAAAEPGTFTFRVVPEPGTAELLSLSALLLLCRRRV